MGVPFRPPIELGGHMIEIVESYDGRTALAKVSKVGTALDTRMQADQSIAAIRGELADLGRWERMVSALRNVKEGVEGRGATGANPISLEDLEFRVVERSRLDARLEPFGIVVDLARAASTATASAQRPWLSQSETWVSALENLKRWKDLRGSIRSLLDGR